MQIILIILLLVLALFLIIEEKFVPSPQVVIKKAPEQISHVSDTNSTYVLPQAVAEKDFIQHYQGRPITQPPLSSSDDSQAYSMIVSEIGTKPEIQGLSLDYSDQVKLTDQYIKKGNMKEATRPPTNKQTEPVRTVNDVEQCLTEPKKSSYFRWLKKFGLIARNAIPLDSKISDPYPRRYFHGPHDIPRDQTHPVPQTAHGYFTKLYSDSYYADRDSTIVEYVPSF